MRRNILLTLAFDGTFYHGWQVQKNANSVQSEIHHALTSIFYDIIKVNGCSRTDAGVHAEMFCCNFYIDDDISVKKLPGALNFYLPQDIAVYSAEEKEEDFHARYSCKKKEYVYRIYNGSHRNPLWRGRALQYLRPLDEALLQREANAFLGTHDFTAFCKSGSAVKDKVRTIESISVERDGDLVSIRIVADGFLYNMVRIMVGTLLAIAENKIEPGSIPMILEKKDRRLVGRTVSPEGLYLSKVYY